MISLYRLLLLVGITAGSVGSALADSSEALVNAVAGAFTPAQMSALIMSARGNIKSGNDKVTLSLERLQPMLGVSGDVVLALLRNLDRPDIPAEQAAQALADAVAQYHNLEDQLAQVTSEDSEGHHLVMETQAATKAGRFGDAEALLGRLEEHEAALASSALNTVTDPTSSTTHLIRAAQARAALGHIALLELRYDEATDAFRRTQQRLALVPAAQPNSTGRRSDQSFPASALMEQESIKGSAVAPDALQSEPASPSSAPATQADTQLTAEGQSPLPRLDIARPEKPTSVAPSDQIDVDHRVASLEPGPTAIGLSTVATIQLGAATTATPRGVLEQPAGLSSTGAVSKDRSMGRSLSADTLALLLRRGDASLAVGDVSSARLLYERAAAEGDGPAATGAGKTYDPLFLSEIGALGTQGNWETAAAWYHRAIELGDKSAGDRLKQISSRSRMLAPADAQPKRQASPQSVPSKVSPVMSGRLRGTIGTGASLAASGAPVAPSDAGTVVARQAANVRDAPNNGSTILRTVPKGAVLRVYSRREGWIQSGDATAWGWVYSGLLEPVQ